MLRDILNPNHEKVAFAEIFFLKDFLICWGQPETGWPDWGSSPFPMSPEKTSPPITCKKNCPRVSPNRQSINCLNLFTIVICFAGHYSLKPTP